jgi:hypothetical protein
LAKRFGCESRLDDRSAIIRGDGDLPGLFEFDPTKAPKQAASYQVCFECVDPERDDTVVAFGWAMAEALAAAALPR